MPGLGLALASLVAALAVALAPTDTTRLVLVATTDVHGRAMAWDYVRDREAPLGLVRAATAVDSLRRLYPGRVVLVDAGDLIQGNPFAAYFARVARDAPHPILDLMSRMGYDAATVGNHEFNFGLEVLGRALRVARFPYVSANIVADSGPPPFAPYVIVERAGVRVGITGVTTPGVMVWDGATVRGRLRVRDIVGATPPVVRRMRQAGADLTVVLAHSGVEGPSSYGEALGVPAENAVAALAAAAPGTDVIVVGHSHREMADSVRDGVLLVQPRNWAQSLAVVHLDLVREGGAEGGGGGGGGHWRLVRRRGEILPLARVRPDSLLVSAFGAAHEAARAFALTPLGESVVAMPARTARLEDTPVIDFINAVQRERTGADLSVTAAFDTAGGIPRGQVRLADLAGIYPYENTLRAIRISGADLVAYLEWSARYYRGIGPNGPIVNDSIPGYNFDILSGADYALDLARPLSRRVVSVTVGGRPVAAGDSFTLALNSYRQAGGGGYAMIARAPVVYDRNEDIRDLLAEAIRRRGTIRPEDFFVRNWAIVGRVGPDGRGDSVLLRVLTTNDVHGALLPRTYAWSAGRLVGGAAALAGMMDRLERECGCPTLRLDGGDVMQGTPISNLTFGRSTVEVYNAIGYAAAAIGNHEFDWTIDTLAARVRQSRFPWLSANVREAAGGAVPPWAVPWRMVRAGPLRVALVGYTTESTPVTTKPDHVASLRFSEGTRAVDSVVAVARQEGADLAIVVAHAGAVCGRERGCAGEIVDLAGRLSRPVDLIVAGHTHAEVATTVNGSPIVEARANAAAVGIVDILALPGGAGEAGGAGSAGRVARLRVETVWADRERADTAVEAIVERYRRESDRIARRPIVRLAEPLTRQGDEYPLGDLIADAQRLAARADVAIMNNGGIRADLPAGPVTYGDLFEVQPFQNLLVRIRTSGRVLRAALERAAGGGDAGGGGGRGGGGAGGDRRAHVSGVRLVVDTTRPAGQRIVRLRLLDGRPIEETGSYLLAVTDFLAMGGSGYGMLRGLPSEPVGMTDLEALIAHLGRLRQPVRLPAERRIERVAPVPGR